MRRVRIGVVYNGQSHEFVVETDQDDEALVRDFLEYANVEVVESSPMEYEQGSKAALIQEFFGQMEEEDVQAFADRILGTPNSGPTAPINQQ